MSVLTFVAFVVALLLASLCLLSIGRAAARNVSMLDKLIEVNYRLMRSQHELFQVGRGSASSVLEIQVSLDRLWRLRIEQARMARRLGSGRSLPDPPEPSLLAPAPIF